VSVRTFLGNIFQPAPHAEQIQDDTEIRTKYKYWRMRIFYSMYMGYVFYYFTRKSFTFVVPMIKNELGIDEVGIGWIGTVFAISYGVSKFTCGVLSDRSNPRYFMGIGLLMTGVLNFFFGMSSSLLFFMVFWGLNGWFQGTGWPPCARLLTHWYSQKERGTWWGLWNTSHNIGGAVIPLLATYCAMHFGGWRYGLFVPGFIGIIIGIILLNRLRDTPQSLGLPPVEKFRNDYHGGTEKGEEERELSTKEILFEYVLNNKYIWVLAISYFFVYIVRQAMNDWTMLFFTEHKGYTGMQAGGCVCWFEVGGFFGSFLAGWGSDYFFRGRRGPVNVFFSIGMALTVLALWFSPPQSVFLDSFIIFLIGFFVFGPQMLIGVAAAELSHKKAAATATGFAGLFAYAGAAVAGAPLGYIIRDYGWENFFISVVACGFIVVLLLLPIISAKVNPRYANK
jgi:MFS transporter, OPA family, sugar phosphate sensor protein UhpC